MSGRRSSKGGPDRRTILGLGVVLASAAAGAAAKPATDADNIAGALPWQDGDAAPPEVGRRTERGFLTEAERDFLTAAVDRLIPPDATGPGASEAGVVTFLDRQLAGGYGRGDHLYLGGPWYKGTPSQGLQVRQSPAEMYRSAIAEIAEWIAQHHQGKTLAELPPAEQDAVLRQLEDGTARLASVDAGVFFLILLANTREGYFSDPVYGGNRNMDAWRMIGFPGARYDYSDWVTRHGELVALEPVSLVGRPGWKPAGP